MSGSLAVYRVLYLAACVALLSAQVALASTSPIRQLTSSSGASLRPAWSPDGAKIAFQSSRDGPFHVYVMNADGSGVRRLTTGGTDDRHPAWSPDGRHVAVDSGGSGQREIFVIEVATGARTQVTRLGAVASFPSWSPDGSLISFYVYQQGVMDVFIAGRDGSGLAQLTRDFATERNQQCTFACHAAAWSPNGLRLALSDGTLSRVLLMSASVGSSITAISPADERSHFPVYLADGRLVYVTEHVSLDQSWTDLWVVDPAHPDKRAEIARDVRVQGPFALNRDGTQLLFASPRSGNFQIYAVTLDDAGRAALAERPERLSGRPDASDGTGEQPLAGGAPAAVIDALGGVAPFILALGALALLGVGIEVAVRRRRRSGSS